MDEIAQEVSPFSCFAYRTVKHVVIRSAWLKIPHVVLLLSILFYLLVYQILFLGCLLTESVVTRASAALDHPLVVDDLDETHVNARDCTDSDMNCKWRIPRNNNTYCRKEAPTPGIVVLEDKVYQENRTRRRVEGCAVVDIHDALPNMIAPGQTLLIPTMISVIIQDRCANTSGCGNIAYQDWMNAQVNEYFVADIEAFTVTFWHNWHALSEHGSGIGDQGFLEDAQGHIRRVSCTAADCSYTRQVWEAIKACGTTHMDEDACFSSSRGDVVSVKKLLEAGDIDLDSPSPGFENNVTYRQTGVDLTLAIVYTNLDVWEYWQFPIGPKRKYTYKLGKDLDELPRQVFVTQRFPVIDSKGGGQGNPNRRILHRHTGILLQLHPYGTMGVFSFRQLLLSISGCLILLTLADFVVEQILTRLYERCACTKHVKMLWDLYKKEESITEETFNRRLSELNLLVDEGTPFPDLRPEEKLYLLRTVSTDLSWSATSELANDVQPM